LPEIDELQSLINKAVRDLEKSHEKALKDVEKMKETINRLELNMSRKRRTTSKDMDALNSAIQSLNELSDSQILRSERAWEEYEKLERDCKVHTLKPVGIDNLRVLCKETEELAANLLCFSLAHFRRKS